MSNESSSSYSANEFIDALLLGESDEGKIAILRNCLDHALTHPWVDSDLLDSIVDNIANEYGIDSPTGNTYQEAPKS